MLLVSHCFHHDVYTSSVSPVGLSDFFALLQEVNMYCCFQ